MKQNYMIIIPPRFQEADYNEVPIEIREREIEQIRKREGLYMWGGPGVGKTYIACALAKKLMEEGFSVMFHNTGEFLEKLRREFGAPYNEEGDLFKDVMEFKGVLILDDIGAEKASDWTRERLYLIINKKYEERLPIIFTSNCDIEILSARMGDRITSRIVGMTSVLKISGEDKRFVQK